MTVSKRPTDYVTDEQWISVTSLVGEDDGEWAIHWPNLDGHSVRMIDPNGDGVIVRADGTVIGP